VGALQAKLFAEGAQRAAVLRSQRIELDIRYMEAEARHRAAMQRVRAELAEAEAKHADALATQESESAERLAIAEVDFAVALREAARTGAVLADRVPPPEATTTDDDDTSLPAATGAADEGDEGDGGSTRPTSTRPATRAEIPSAAELLGSGASSSPTTGAGGEAGEQTTTRVLQAIQALRRRTETQLAEAEVRHAEALLRERERADRRLAAAERNHEEALRAAREAGERRLAALREAQGQGLPSRMTGGPCSPTSTGGSEDRAE
jgi:hypothetical protein